MTWHPRITVDTQHMMARHVHGTHGKDMIVCHETVSHDVRGLADGNAIASYLAGKDYGIHAVIDREGNLWWARGLSVAIFYHAASSGRFGDGLVNSRGIGVELVSYPQGSIASQRRKWLQRERQLNKLARLIEWQSHRHHFPLHVSDSSASGVTTHWNVTHRWGVDGGHVDCFPKHSGGYFPLGRVVQQARAYRAIRLAMARG